MPVTGQDHSRPRTRWEPREIEAAMTAPVEMNLSERLNALDESVARASEEVYRLFEVLDMGGQPTVGAQEKQPEQQHSTVADRHWLAVGAITQRVETVATQISRIRSEVERLR